MDNLSLDQRAAIVVAFFTTALVPFDATGQSAPLRRAVADLLERTEPDMPNRLMVEMSQEFRKRLAAG